MTPLTNIEREQLSALKKLVADTQRAFALAIQLDEQARANWPEVAQALDLCRHLVSLLYALAKTAPEMVAVFFGEVAEESTELLVRLSIAETEQSKVIAAHLLGGVELLRTVVALGIQIFEAR